MVTSEERPITMQKKYNNGAISVFGSSGFVGSNYIRESSKPIVAIPKHSREAQSADILYLIGTVHNYNIFDNPQLDIDVNLKILIETLEINRKQFPDMVFNFVSTWFVYGENQIPYSESAHCNPKGFYSITKYAAELLLESYCKTHEIDYRIIRLGNVFGHGDKKVSNKKNAIQFLVEKIRNGEDIELYEGGFITRDYIHVNDVARGIDLIIDKGEKNEIYNLASGSGTLLHDLLSDFRESIQSKSKFIPIPTPRFHSIVQVKDAVLDTTKLKALGFILKYPISIELLKGL